MRTSYTTARHIWAAAAVCALAASLTAPSSHATSPTVRSVPTGDSVQDRPAAQVPTDLKPVDAYLIELHDAPAASYTGGTPGLARTQPEPGQKLDSQADHVQRYVEHLTNEQKAIATAADVDVVSHLATISNSFTAKLTPEQVERLAADPRVKAIHANEQLTLQTNTTPNLLGLDGGQGIWREFGTPRRAGEGVVVGIMDTGIAAQNPSFAGKPMPTQSTGKVNEPSMDADGNVTMLKSDGKTFNGKCEVGEGFSLSDCNDKLIAARSYGNVYWILNGGAKNKSPREFMSARDGNSHGSHVAGTAVGNFGVPVTLKGQLQGRVSGMAPGAKLAVYKVGWTSLDENGKERNGIMSLDAILAANQAVIDGVDVLNYSVSGTSDDPGDPVGLAFLRAAEAGVFVATAAGNSGPGPATLNHVMPWTTTVAAAATKVTHGTVVLGDGSKHLGVSESKTGLPAGAPLVHAKSIVAAGASATDAALCKEKSLDDAQAAGKIVICDRGEIGRPDKSVEVKRAGGAGMILANVTPSSLNADVHSVPTVHVDEVAGSKIRDYLNATNPTAKLLPGNSTGLPNFSVPFVDGYSSRGPSLLRDEAFLKPDITAPGSDVLAAVAPQFANADYGTMSGTSMATPHIAGLATLILGKHPTFTPAQIKSAMMTTAKPMSLFSGKPDTDRFSTGAGYVNPRGFLDPGLVFQAGRDDWHGYLRSVGVNLGSDVKAVAAKDVNSASLVANGFVDEVTLTRTATAVTPGTYTASADVPGVETVISPAKLTFTKPGETQQFTVTFKRGKATPGSYQHGTVTWTGAGKTVRMATVVRPEPAALPLTINGTTGSDVTAKANLAPGVTLDGSVNGFAHMRQTTTRLVAVDGVARPATVRLNSPREAGVWVYIKATGGEGVENVTLKAEGVLGLVNYPDYLGSEADVTPSKVREMWVFSRRASTVDARVAATGVTGSGADIKVEYAFLPTAKPTATGSLEPATLVGGEGGEQTVTIKPAGAPGAAALDAAKAYVGIVTYKDKASGRSINSFVRLDPAAK